MSNAESAPLVSVILVCYNSAQWLPKCLESLRAQTVFAQIEVLLVDNASSDDSEGLSRTLTGSWSNSRIVQTGRNVGFSANNIGAKVARGKYLYLLNPDTWLEPDCIEELIKAVELSGAGGAGSTVLEYDSDDIQAKGSHGFDLFGNPVSPAGQRAPDPLFCIAGFYFIKRDLFLRLGMLDEQFFMYGEEMDLSWRIWISGERLVHAPAALVHHRGAVAVNPAGGAQVVENRTSPTKRFLANRNFLLVIAKNSQHVLLLLLIPCTLLILLEGFLTLLVTRQWSLVRKTCFGALADFWRLRGHVLTERRRLKSLRRRSDFWMLRFLRFGFGRSHEVRQFLKLGFPKFG